MSKPQQQQSVWTAAAGAPLERRCCAQGGGGTPGCADLYQCAHKWSAPGLCRASGAGSRFSQGL